MFPKPSILNLDRTGKKECQSAQTNLKLDFVTLLLWEVKYFDSLNLDECIQVSQNKQVFHPVMLA